MCGPAVYGRRALAGKLRAGYARPLLSCTARVRLRESCGPGMPGPYKVLSVRFYHDTFKKSVKSAKSIYSVY